jgi:magnesium transporter
MPLSLLKKFDLVTLPVVDSETRLVGVLEYDRAMDILQEEADEDILEKGGLINLQETGKKTMSNRVIYGSLYQVLKVRLPFLLITLVGGMLAGLVMSTFEEAIKSVIALTFFMPLVMDMGGNVGTQSTTIFTRSLVLGHIRPTVLPVPYSRKSAGAWSWG